VKKIAVYKQRLAVSYKFFIYCVLFEALSSENKRHSAYWCINSRTDVLHGSGSLQFWKRLASVVAVKEGWSV